MWFLGLFSFITRAGIIYSVFKTQEREPADLKKAWLGNKPFIFRMLVISAVFAVLMLLAGLFLGMPPYLLLQRGLFNQALVLFGVAGLIFIFFFAAVSAATTFASIFVVSGNMEAEQALRAGFELAARHFSRILPPAALLFIINFIFSAGADKVHGLGLGAVLVLSFGGVIAAFQTVLWTLVWQELVKTEKSKDAGENLPISEPAAVD